MIGFFTVMAVLATDGSACACVCRYDPQEMVGKFNRFLFTDILLVRTSASVKRSTRAAVVQVWKGTSKPGDSIRVTRRLPPRTDCDHVTLLPATEYLIFAERTSTGDDLVVSECDVLRGKHADEVATLLSRPTRGSE